jgi:deoxycytidine triphosphate deaminase
MSGIPAENKLKYEDPHSDEHGLLLSNRIHEFCKEGLLISKDYRQENLRPASYTLRIGDDFIDSEGNVRRMTEAKDSIVFKKNSIIFVSTKEKLDLPYYVIARFNLRVNWVYDGVLLGTGPQVDPGFSGYLSCPLYNLTNVDITITRAQDFATIDFEKTTPLLEGVDLEKKKEIIERAKDKELEIVDGEYYSFYKSPSFKPLHHRKSHRMVSTLFELRKELRTWRSLGIGSLIAFFGLTLSLLAFGANLYRQSSDLSRQNSDLVRQNNDFSRQLVEGKNDVHQATERISKLEADMDRLMRASKQNQPKSKMVDSGQGKKNSR